VARLTVWTIVAAVLAAVTANVLRLAGAESLAGPWPAAQCLEVGSGAAAVLVAGVGHRSWEYWLVAAAGACWLSVEWASPSAPGSAAFTVGLVCSLAALPLVLISRLRRSLAAMQRALLGLAALLALAAAAISGPVAAAVASPRDAGCTACPADILPSAHDVALGTSLGRIGGVLAIAAGLAAVGWLAVAKAGPQLRNSAASLSAGDAADAACAGFAAAVAASSAVLLAGRLGAAVYALRAVADSMLVLLAVAVAEPMVRAARARRQVARAAVAIADTGGNAVVALRAALGDSALRVAYPASDGTWHDSRGQPVTLPEHDVTVVMDTGESVAALLHGATARVRQAAVSGAVSAARLLLDIERIEAGTLARVNDLRTARQLAVAAAESARAGLERDLHDGAQRRLVALRYALGLALARAERRGEHALTALLAEADNAAEQALAELRELAHGIGTDVLAVEGLGGALRATADRMQRAVTISDLPDSPLPTPIEQTVYRLVVGALRDCAASPAGLAIAVRKADLNVVVEFELAGAATATWPPESISDRVAATGGQIQCEVGDDRQRVIVVLPCE
jgi:signal transduction histidine kinase